MPMPPIPTKWTCLKRLNTGRPLQEIYDPRLRVQNCDAPRVCFDFSQSLRIAYQLANRISQPFAVEIGITDQDGCILVRHRPSVLRLVIIGRKRKWNEDRRAACGFDLGDRRGTGPRNDQISSSVLLVKIVEEGLHIRVEALRRVSALDLIQLPLAGLMDKLQPVFPIRQVVERLDNGAID